MDKPSRSARRRQPRPTDLGVARSAICSAPDGVARAIFLSEAPRRAHRFTPTQYASLLPARAAPAAIRATRTGESRPTKPPPASACGFLPWSVVRAGKRFQRDGPGHSVGPPNHEAKNGDRSGHQKSVLTHDPSKFLYDKLAIVQLRDALKGSLRRLKPASSHRWKGEPSRIRSM
jgi:hypothetical protein